MIKLDKVSKTFWNGNSGLLEVSLFVEKGEFVFLVGPTGSGKTTLFRLLIKEVLPSKGAITVGDFDLIKLPHSKISHLRKKIGVIFQDLKLLLDRTIIENIVLPLEVSGFKPEDARKRAEEIMSKIGIIEHRDKFPIQLSGGELQRTAIARALILSPDLLLADEPTGNLDPKTSKEIVDLLLDINKKGTTVIMATHNVEIVNSLGKRVVSLEKGKLVKDEKKGKYGVS
ncbi:MAG: ATP-binding cassette domain-containing protein [bacterium]|nr:ATP-binding cassette domain-containing protein [bacterium]